MEPFYLLYICADVAGCYLLLHLDSAHLWPGIVIAHVTTWPPQDEVNHTLKALRSYSSLAGDELILIGMQ